MKSATRNRAFRNVRMRRLLQCGTALPLALLAMPAQAACTVEGDTTTCTGDISGGIGTSTPNVVVTDLTTDAGAPAGFSAIWLPDVATAQIDTGDHALNVQGAAAIAAVSGNPIDMDFTGTINVSGLDPAGNSGAGVIANANGDGGWDASVRSTGDITVDVTRDANSSQNGNRGILANGGTAGTATIESTGNVSVTVSGMSTFAMGLQAAAGAGASITNTGDVSVIAAGGFGSAIGATSVADTVVSSVGNVSADFGPGVGYGISAGGLRNTIQSQGDVTADEGGIVAQGHLLYDDEGALLPYFAIAESSEITSTGNVSTSGNGAPAILALGDEVTVNSTGAITTTGMSASTSASGPCLSSPAG